MRGVENLIPEAQEAANAFLERCRYWGYNVLITDTLRTKAEQDALYAQGRTAPGNIVTSCRYPHSLHNWGCAFDFCKNYKGAEYDNSDGFFDKCGKIAEDLGLIWGGHFKNVDKPHIQLNKYSTDKTAKWLIANYGTPIKFLAEKTAQKPQEDKMTAKELLALITPEIALEIATRAKKAMCKLTVMTDEEAVAMMYAANKGIYHGDESGNLMPQKPLTRAEYAIIQLRLDNKKNKG